MITIIDVDSFQNYERIINQALFVGTKKAFKESLEEIKKELLDAYSYESFVEVNLVRAKTKEERELDKIILTDERDSL